MMIEVLTLIYVIIGMWMCGHIFLYLLAETFGHEPEETISMDIMSVLFVLMLSTISICAGALWPSIIVMMLIERSKRRCK